ncbi:MAG: tetratricopeptide repeat protein [Cyanobacteria bacterium P01_C01_bin.89]
MNRLLCSLVSLVVAPVVLGSSAAIAQASLQNTPTAQFAPTVDGESSYDRSMRLGYAAMEAGNPEVASSYFRNALYSVPNDNEATVAYWNARDAMKELANEGGEFDRHMEIGYDATERGDYQTALINFRRALEVRPMDPYATQAARNVQTYIERGEDPDAPRDVSNIATFYVGERPYDRYMRLGYAAVQREDYRSAVSQFRSALSIRPNDRQAKIAYWNAVDGMRDGDYGTGSEVRESTYDRYMRLGYDATEDQQYSRALGFFQSALRLRPQDGYAPQAIRNVRTYMRAQ